MKILLAVFLCATCVLCTPVTESPQNDIQKKVSQTSLSENDIVLKKNIQPVDDKSKPDVVETIPLTKEQEAKGEEILENIFTKIVGKINDVIKADNMNDSNTNILNTTVTAEVRDVIVDPKSEITKHGPTSFEPIKPIDHDDPFEYPTYDYIPDYPLNPSMNPYSKDSVYSTVPADLLPKEPEMEKRPNEKQPFVEIPLEMQKSNNDGTLPDIDDEIKDTIINDPSFQNPILSPYDTLPLDSINESSAHIDPMAAEQDSTPDMDVFPEPEQQEDFSLNTDAHDHPFALDAVHEMEPLDFNMENEQNNPVDETTLNQHNLDYDNYDEIPIINDYNNYDYDIQDRHFPAPNHFRPMHPFMMNQNPFGKPSHMVNNAHFDHPSMMNPFNRKQSIYHGMPFNSYHNTPNDLFKGPAIGPKVPYSDISQLMEQILPEIFKKTSPNNPGEKIDTIILIEGNPSPKKNIIKKHSPKVDHPESQIPKQNGQLFIEIGNMNPLMNDIYEQSASPTSRFPSMMKALFKNSLTAEDQRENIEPFGIKPVGEEFQNVPDTMEPTEEEQINEIDSQNWDFNPMKIYAPAFQHAYFMHPELYKMIYPNRQYMSQPPYFNHYSENRQPPMNYENQQSIVPPMNYNQEQIIPPMNFVNREPMVPPMNFANREPIEPPMNFGNREPIVPHMNFGNRGPTVPPMNFANREPIEPPMNFGNRGPTVPPMNMNFGNREPIEPPMNFGNRGPTVPPMNHGNREPIYPPMNYENQEPITSPMNFENDFIDTGYRNNMGNMNNNYMRFPNQYNMRYNRDFYGNNFQNPMMNNYNTFPADTSFMNGFNRFYQPSPYGPYPNPNY